MTSDPSSSQRHLRARRARTDTGLAPHAGAGPAATNAAKTDELPFIEYGGRIVAVAGRTRCYIAVDDLDAATLNFVVVMCLCKREVDEGRLEGPFNSELASKWARLVMIGPQHFAGLPKTDHELADQLAVPVEQVAIARREFGHLRSATG